MIGVLGSLAEYERELTKERAALKRATSRANGTRFGRPRKVADAEHIANRQADEGRRPHWQRYRPIPRRQPGDPVPVLDRIISWYSPAGLIVRSSRTRLPYPRFPHTFPSLCPWPYDAEMEGAQADDGLAVDLGDGSKSTRQKSGPTSTATSAVTRVTYSRAATSSVTRRWAIRTGSSLQTYWR